MRLKPPTGLFDQLALQFGIIEKLPRGVIDKAGFLMNTLKLIPEDGRKSMNALWEPHVKEASLDYTKMAATWIMEAKRAAKQGKKVILVPFNFPGELIHAFDSAVPLTSEVLTTLGVSVLKGQGEDYWDVAMGLGLPDHICSANAIELGSVLSGDDFKPDAIISSSPGGCDVNAKIHEFVSHYLDIPQFFLQKPTEDSGRGRQWYGTYMKNLVTDLERFLGETLDEERLRETMIRANRCTELYYDLWDLQQAVPCPVPNIFSLFLYGTRFSMWGTETGVAMMETLVRVSRDRLAQKAYPAKRERARSLWAYTSYYYDFYGFFSWMEKQGISHLGDGLDLFFPKIVDTTSLESMIEGLTEAAWNMPMTRQVGAESMSGSWTDDVVYAAKSLNADCVIYCGHHSCKQTWGVISILRNELAKRLDIPILILQGDSWMKKMTPMSDLQNQVEEFVNNVVARQDSGKRKIRQRKQAKAARRSAEKS